MGLTFWKRKFLSPLLYRVFTQSIAQLTVSTMVAPLIPLPVNRALAPTSFVPIHNVKIVSEGFSARKESFAFSEKNSGSWDSKTDGKGRAVMLLEHVAPERANGKRLK